MVHGRLLWSRANTEIKVQWVNVAEGKLSPCIWLVFVQMPELWFVWELGRKQRVWKWDHKLWSEGTVTEGTTLVTSPTRFTYTVSSCWGCPRVSLRGFLTFFWSCEPLNAPVSPSRCLLSATSTLCNNWYWKKPLDQNTLAKTIARMQICRI